MYRPLTADERPRSGDRGRKIGEQRWTYFEQRSMIPRDITGMEFQRYIRWQSYVPIGCPNCKGTGKKWHARKISINFPIFIRYDAEANVFVGYCPGLKIYSQGKTYKEAVRSTRGAVLLVIQHLSLEWGKEMLKGQGEVNADKERLTKAKPSGR